MRTTPRIYVADLAAYNDGLLHGIWIDATQEIETIYEQIRQMLAYSPIKSAEEFAVHDFENFGNYRVGEFEGIETVHAVACFITEYPDFGSELLSYFGSVEESREIAENNYCGCYTSMADYAQEFTEQAGDIPQHLAPYIDYQAMARDWTMSGDVLAIEIGIQQVHIFYNR